MNSKSGKQFHVPVLAVIGVGMIGGSLALALKNRKAVDRVIGYGRNRENLEKALSMGAIDTIAESAAAAAAEADIIVLATPVGSMAALIEEILPVLGSDAILTDVGSVKHSVAEQARALMGARLAQFVPAHPVAGKEHSGVSAASADLYENHRVAVTPLAESAQDSVQRIADMWRLAGAEVVVMEVAEHDRVLAMTSHLPHVLAYAMVDFFAGQQDHEKCYQMAAGGFYDFTRIASSDPVMWRDICAMNKQQVLAHIAGFQQRLDAIVELLETNQLDQLESLFADARAARAVVTERRKLQPAEDPRLATGRRRVQQLVNR